jgi:hypothetical protein
MRRLAALALLGTALAVTGVAAAKGPDRARVCGTTCRTITGDQNVWPLLGAWLEGTFVQADAPRLAPFFTFKIDSTRGESGRWVLVWVPSKRLLRVTQIAVPPYQLETVGPYWRRVPAATRAAFAAATRGLRARRGAFPRSVR